jgi:hypothetical protein
VLRVPDQPSEGLGPDEDGAVLEDDGVLPPADSLDGEPTDDVLDTGVDAGDGYRASTRYGTTRAEERRGESLDQLLAEEEPDRPVELPWTDDEYGPDDEDVPFARAGRLVAPDEGSRPDRDPDLDARDVGVDGGGASAEEAAVHLTFEPDFH